VGAAVEELAGLVDAAAGEEQAGRRAQLYARVEQLALIEIAALAPLYHGSRPYAAKPYLQRNYPLAGGSDIENWFVDAH
jgi:ABC-type oligopeptide transport system substrate-binding subunit